MNYLNRKWVVTRTDSGAFLVREDEIGPSYRPGRELTPDEIKRLIEAAPAMFDELKDIADNYDHDDDGHRYNTGCRCCKAQDVIDSIFPDGNE